MTAAHTIYADLSIRINEATGLHITAGTIDMGGEPMAVLPATDLLALAGIVELAKRGAAVPPNTATIACSVKKTVDWSAAGRKSWETRRRNEVARKRPTKKPSK